MPAFRFLMDSVTEKCKVMLSSVVTRPYPPHIARSGYSVELLPGSGCRDVFQRTNNCRKITGPFKGGGSCFLFRFPGPR